MNMRHTFAVALATGLAAGAANAAILSVVDPGNVSQSFVLNSGAAVGAPFDLGGAIYNSLVPVGAGRSGDTIDAFTGAVKNASNGLSLNTFSTITFTYLGSDAFFQNLALEIENDVILFRNRDGVGGALDTPVGKSISGYAFGPGFLPFAYESSNGGRIANNGVAASNGLAIGYGRTFVDSKTPLGGQSINIFFNDPGGSPTGPIVGIDGDFDDMGVRIDVAPVPLPAAGWMLMAALGGIAALSRRRTA